MKTKYLSRWRGLFAMGLLLFVAAGCTSRGSKTNQRHETKAPAIANDLSEHYFDGEKYCVQTFLEGPAPRQPLHFSNKVIESDQSLHSRVYEADLSADNLDVIQRERWLATDDDRKFFEESRKSDDPKGIVRAVYDGVAEKTVVSHFTPSDEPGWRVGVTFLAQGGKPWRLLIYKPPVARAGAENINGYETMKYTVDTTHQSQLREIGRLSPPTEGLQHHWRGVGSQGCRLHLAICN